MNTDISREKIKTNIIKSVTDLNEKKTLRLVEKALNAGISMSDIAEYLQQGMDNVGELFEKEEYFIGDLIMAGIIFKEVMKLDKRSVADQKEAPGSRGTILIGTIHGDRSGQSVIEDKSLLHPGLVVSDIVYNPRETKLLKMAEEQGCKTVGGLGMLLWQGADAFKLWTGHEMPVYDVQNKYFK